jgi:3-deoxy-7-phosphoheptulonate synthase
MEKENSSRNVNGLSDKNVSSYGIPVIPNEIKNEIPIDADSKKIVLETRETIRNIMNGKDKRKIIAHGPCSLSGCPSEIEYAERTAKLAKVPEIEDNFLLLMRAYFQKPRTKVGWNGLTADPFMNQTYDMKNGYLLGRRILRDISRIGVGCMTEYLEVFTPQYIGQFISLGTTGARNVEYQPLRVMASGLSSPVCFKNERSGDLITAVEAQIVAREKGGFLGINDEGLACPILTTGNPYSCVFLRGSKNGPNYNLEIIKSLLDMQIREGVNPGVFVDCSHDQIKDKNGKKDVYRQIEVALNVLNSMTLEKDIIGFSLESHINEGKQPEPKSKEEKERAKYGVSFTDPCLSWEITEGLIRKSAEILRSKK